MAVLKSKILLDSSKTTQSSEMKNALNANIMIDHEGTFVHAADDLDVHGAEAVVDTSSKSPVAAVARVNEHVTRLRASKSKGRGCVVRLLHPLSFLRSRRLASRIPKIRSLFTKVPTETARQQRVGQAAGEE